MTARPGSISTNSMPKARLAASSAIISTPTRVAIVAASISDP
jgi:hypothetical protein